MHSISCIGNITAVSFTSSSIHVVSSYFVFCVYLLGFVASYLGYLIEYSFA